VTVILLILAAVLGVLAGAHWYVWRRLVRDTTARGGWARRAGTALVIALPLTTLAAILSGRAGAPFVLQRVLAWPGYLWLALLLYLTLALLAGEAVRPLPARWSAARAAERVAARPVRAAGPPGSPRPRGDDVRVGVAEPRQLAVGPGTSTATGTPGADATAEPKGAVPTGGADAGPTAPQDPPPPSAGADPPGDGGAGDADALSRRLFVARTVAVAASAVAAGTVAYGTYDVFKGPSVKRVRVPLAKLPRSADGYRIAVVSDIHLGPILGRAHAQRVVDTINRTQPDLVAVVGDLVDGSVADLGPAAEPLAHLRSRHGSYFVTGNHEYFSGAAQWVDHVRELGVHPLENARVELPGFDLAGVNDISAERLDPAEGPDYEKALGDRDPARASVLLAHQPVMIHEAVEHGVDLQLSGHTHGGQLWPGNYIAALANPTVAGLERYGDTQLYVTRGAGAWGPPVRVGAEPDITVVTLASPHA
jgi:predicted MPP superfamily phosphohydrolase